MIAHASGFKASKAGKAEKSRFRRQKQTLLRLLLNHASIAATS